MTVHFIGAGPGAPDLLTLRAVERLGRCSVCLYAGSLIPTAVLEHLKPGAEAINTAGMALEDIITRMIEATAAGDDVARLHSGDLALYSALAEQLRRLAAADIDYTLTPGVPAFSAAAAALAQELTVPEVGQSLVITRTQGRASNMPAGETLETFAASGTTLAIHLSLQVVVEVVERLLPFYGAACPAAIVQRASWAEERVIRAPLGELDGAAETLAAKRNAIIFVGPVLGATDFRESKLYDPTHRSRYRWASED
ncbi:precorrin-4 C(11)-methyltransferase [Salinisphaera sp. SPP-AMP-43]|uniref:precorrin-4 C(11)-methyltransferase n=1 Tax=Salinisphaera sp. SPP-AMP-43 TaxID=3121288 RepID=UPI003C6E4EDC